MDAYAPECSDSRDALQSAAQHLVRAGESCGTTVRPCCHLRKNQGRQGRRVRPSSVSAHPTDESVAEQGRLNLGGDNSDESHRQHVTATQSDARSGGPRTQLVHLGERGFAVGRNGQAILALGSGPGGDKHPLFGD